MAKKIPAFEDEAVTITVYSGECEAEGMYTHINMPVKQRMGPAFSVCMSWIKLRASDLEAAGLVQRAGGTFSNELPPRHTPTVHGVLDRASFDEGVRAARAAIADAKYDADKFGQPWSVRDVIVKWPGDT